MLALFCVGEGRAEVQRKDGQVELLAVGGFCMTVPDGYKPAPLTHKGWVGEFDLPYDVVIGGTVVPAGRDVGVGLIVRLPDSDPGEEVKIQAWKRGGPGGRDTWMEEVGADRQIWPSLYPDPGGRLDEGVYRINVLRGQALVLSVDFLIVPPGKEPCLRLTS